ncbi:MAG: hypothetical protein VB858_13795, partial [Planctomycetaceae bacterium]
CAVCGDGMKRLSGHLDRCHVCRGCLDHLTDNVSAMNKTSARSVVDGRRGTACPVESSASLSPRLQSVMAGFAENLASGTGGLPNSQAPSEGTGPHDRRCGRCAGIVSVTVLLILCIAGGKNPSPAPGHSDSSTDPSASDTGILSQAAVFQPAPDYGIVRASADQPMIGLDGDINRENVIVVTLDGRPEAPPLTASSNVKLQGVTIIVRPPVAREEAAADSANIESGNPVLIDVVDATIEMQECRVRSPVPVTLIRTTGASQVNLSGCQVDLLSGVLLDERGDGASLTLRNSRLRTGTLANIDQARSSASAAELKSVPQPVTRILVEESVLDWNVSLVNLEGLPACLNGVSGTGPHRRIEWIQSTLHWSGKTATCIPEYTSARRLKTGIAAGNLSTLKPIAWLTVNGRVLRNFEVVTMNDWLTLLGQPGTRKL